MGNCQQQESSLSEFEINIQSLSSFKLLCLIGKGAFGRVWKVKQHKTHQLFALKEISKAKVVKYKQQHAVMNERNLLARLNHPFITNMKCAFQNEKNLYIVMDLVDGGDLRSYLQRQKTFTEAQTKFIAICILFALQYLHNNIVVHLDIKPENIIFDMSGYPKLCDFGISHIWRPDNEKFNSGTPGYMAPEVICKQKHGVAADYFSLGVVLYELLTGERPYPGRTRQEIRDVMLSKSAKLKGQFSQECKDFVNKLLLRKPSIRLGRDGPEQVFSHPWIRCIQLEPYYLQQAPSLIQPYNRDHYNENISLTEESVGEINQTDFIGFDYADSLFDQNDTRIATMKIA